jgi:hypothetical protein
MSDNNIWLGRSQWDDSVFDGLYDELRIYDSALSAGAVASHFQVGPNVVPEPTSIGLSILAVGLLATAGRCGKSRSR